MFSQFNYLCREATLYHAWNYVKSKGSAGGIDGVSIEEFNKGKYKQIHQIQEELKNGSWKPQPYLQISIPKTKDPKEKRILGMAAVKDKVIQQAIRLTIEPRLERIFLTNSYAYRPGKSALKRDYLRELMSDDEVGFERREHQGATDLVNSMLNYGYSILYHRVWQALLAARLNPFNSLIHARQDGKPTLVYDMVEIFRSQVVDRIVISLIQKGQELEVRNGLLTETTRKLLVKSVMERLSRYERYKGEEMKMENIVVRQAKLLAKAFEGTEKFKPYVAKW